MWGFSNEKDYTKLMKRYPLPENKPYILWSDKGNPVFISFANELTDGANLFANHSSIGGFDISLPELTSSYRMFALCDNLTFVHADFPKLTNVVEMFYSCPSLEEFKGDLSALIDGQNMFQNCYSMKRFEANIPNLGGAINMFNGCPLEEFKGDLTKLQVADNMFNGGKLNKESVFAIIDNLTNSTVEVTNGKITLGINKELESDDEILKALGSENYNGSIVPLPTGQTVQLTFGNNTWSVTVQWN